MCWIRVSLTNIVVSVIMGCGVSVCGSIQRQGWEPLSFLLKDADLCPELWNHPDLQLQLPHSFQSFSQSPQQHRAFSRLPAVRGMEDVFAGDIPSPEVIPGAQEAAGVIAGFWTLSQQHCEWQAGGAEEIRSDVLTQRLLVKLSDSGLHLPQRFQSRWRKVGPVTIGPGRVALRVSLWLSRSKSSSRSPPGGGEVPGKCACSGALVSPVNGDSSDCISFLNIIYIF